MALEESAGSAHPIAGRGRQTWPYVATLAAISVASRLPQFLGPRLLLDGDEATLGLMANHLAQGREVPIFFWGQHYGLSLIEAGAGAVAFRTFGMGALQLKLAMLAIWTTGVLFLFLAQSKLLGATRSFWITLVLVLTPAWAVWSMKARGGYLTSFAATSILLWVLMKERERATVVRWASAGVLTALVYLAHPLWLPGVLPFLFVSLARRRRLLWPACFSVTAGATLLLVWIATASDPNSWGGPPLDNMNYLGSIPNIARQVYITMTGSYYLWWAIDPPGTTTRLMAVVWCTAIPVVTLAQLYRVFSRHVLLWSHLLFASIVATLVAEWLLLGARDPRYMLPLAAPLVLLAGAEVSDLIDRRLLRRQAALALTIVLILLGTRSMMEFRNFSFLWASPSGSLTEETRLRRVLGYLKGRDVRHVFSGNGLLQWQLMFYSKEDVLARWTDPEDRRPEHVRAVDRALAEGEPIAVVGYTNDSGAPGCDSPPGCTAGIETFAPNPEQIYIVDHKYFVYVGADRALLERLHFRIWD